MRFDPRTKALLGTLTLTTLLSACAEVPSIGWKHNRALCTVAGALAGGAIANGADNAAAGVVVGAGIAYLFCDDAINTCGEHSVKTEQGCDNDLDKDGISNRFDECPDTPDNTSIRSNGCPYTYNQAVEKSPVKENMDLDEDGIENNVDSCPNTPNGATVDNTGCPVIEKISLQDVSFNYKSSELSTQAKAALQVIAETLKSTEETFEIEGHTDSAASQDYNQKLSQQRANSVMYYLASLGINPARMTAAGYGEAQPIASNDTTAGQAKNRRVKFSIQ